MSDLEIVSPETAPPTLPPIESLSIDQVSRLVKVAPQLKAWLAKAEAFGAARLHAGKPFPRFKLVAGRSNRAWTDEGAVAKLVVENGKGKLSDIYKKELLSPAQMEDFLRGKELSTRFTNRLQSLITKPEGKPTMVPEDDPREPFAINPATIFTNLDTEEGANLLA